MRRKDASLAQLRRAAFCRAAPGRVRERSRRDVSRLLLCPHPPPAEPRAREPRRAQWATQRSSTLSASSKSGSFVLVLFLPRRVRRLDLHPVALSERRLDDPPGVDPGRSRALSSLAPNAQSKLSITPDSGSASVPSAHATATSDFTIVFSTGVMR